MLRHLILLAEETPDDNSVVAGPIAFVIFLGLCIAVAILGWSLNNHLKKARRAAEEDVYGDPVEASSDGADRKSADEQ